MIKNRISIDAHQHHSATLESKTGIMFPNDKIKIKSTQICNKNALYDNII